MFTKNPPMKSGLEREIDRLLEQMILFSGEDKEYAEMVDQLSKLYKCKEVDQQVKFSRRISPDTFAVVGGNILGILLIVGHERANVVTSKAMSLLTKLR